ncbi:PqiC family protein [Dongia soli]|uniref:PqiC family protein n=1 Tax=Dongia soli TaxID=600628 RepID=A0ABU5EGJ3_9PROT|nr:PqiC family protein [Dongia soli]MDY0885481.1 PqiC family protein [Dongia soli]
MTKMPRQLFIATLGLTVALGGCASPSPQLYTIAPVSGAEHKAGPAVIVLQQISLARYLERQQIVRSSEGYKLDVLENDWWGEPLSAMLSRVLVEELSQRLPQSTVLGESGAVSVSPDATVELNILRLDQDAAGHVILQAQASINYKDQEAPRLQSFRFSVPPSGSDVQGEVAAISVALGQLADKLAPIIATGRTAR